MQAYILFIRKIIFLIKIHFCYVQLIPILFTAFSNVWYSIRLIVREAFKDEHSGIFISIYQSEFNSSYSALYMQPQLCLGFKHKLLSKFFIKLKFFYKNTKTAFNGAIHNAFCHIWNKLAFQCKEVPSIFHGTRLSYNLVP